MPHTLLSRFDLIYLVLDPDNEECDQRLGKHLVNFYLEADNEALRERKLDMVFIRLVFLIIKRFGKFCFILIIIKFIKFKSSFIILAFQNLQIVSFNCF